MTVWDELVGQPEAVAILSGASRAAAQIVASRRSGATGGDEVLAQMTHAWLFTGPPGSGRSVAARAFAAALQCENGGCGECAACHTVGTGTHADVHMVVPEGLSISVQEMRKIVLTEAPANALLKAVEEPPERTVFLLCAPSTHPDDVPVTIRSRCRVVTLRTPPADAVAGVLVSRGVAPEVAEWAAQASQGHVGRANRLARDPDAQARRAAVLAIPASLTNMAACLEAADKLVKAAEEEAAAFAAERNEPEKEALAAAMGAGGTGKGTAAATRSAGAALKDLERKQKSRTTRAQRDALDRALVDLAAFYRDVMLDQAGAEVASAHPEAAGDVRRLTTLHPEAVLARLDAVLACREALELNVKPRIAVEAMTTALRLP